MAAVAGIAIAEAVTGASIRDRHKRKRPARDFSDRSGFPNFMDYSLGKAAGQVPEDFKAPPKVPEPATAT